MSPVPNVKDFSGVYSDGTSLRYGLNLGAYPHIKGRTPQATTLKFPSTIKVLAWFSGMEALSSSIEYKQELYLTIKLISKCAIFLRR